jgi:hypothetical protein
MSQTQEVLARLEEQMLAFLKGVESGDIQLTCTTGTATRFGGSVTYEAPGGWDLTVYNDNGAWGFIEQIVVAGVPYNFDQLFREFPRVHKYRPPDDVLDRAYDWVRQRARVYVAE